MKSKRIKWIDRDYGKGALNKSVVKDIFLFDPNESIVKADEKKVDITPEVSMSFSESDSSAELSILSADPSPS